MYHMGYKIRIYPTKEQEKRIFEHFNACRFVWNYMLDKQTKRKQENISYMSGYDMAKFLTKEKTRPELSWLNNVSCASLQNVCFDLATAYKRFFQKASGYPQFKSKKRSKLTYPVCCQRFYLNANSVNIQKIGHIKYKSKIQFSSKEQCEFSNIRISYINGKFILSFEKQCENQAFTLTDETMGIDLGIKELAVAVCGCKMLTFHNINKSKKIKKIEQKIAYLRNKISNMYKLSINRNQTKNIMKEENKLRKLYARAKGIRQNYIHQTTHSLVSMLPKKIVMENLDVLAMLKNKNFNKNIQFQCFHEFIRQMKYKCERRGIEFIQADRFFPSSKTCSNCGYLNKNLTIFDRIFICPNCNFVLNRDQNAAINLMRYEA